MTYDEDCAYGSCYGRIGNGLWLAMAAVMRATSPFD